MVEIKRCLVTENRKIFEKNNVKIVIFSKRKYINIIW